MKKIISYACIVMVSMFVFADVIEAKQPRKIAIATFTLKDYPLDEILPMVKSIGVDAINVNPNTKLSKKYPNATFKTMNAEQKEFLKKLLADNGIKIIGSGVVRVKSEKELEDYCELAKEFGFSNLLCECPTKDFPMWEKVMAKYDMKVGLHNHAKDSKANNYYDPKNVLEAIKPYPHMYACPDNGHWSRSGLRGEDCYPILKGRILELHFKDQKEFGSTKNQCVPLGTGELNCKNLLKVLDEIGFDGYFSLEHEGLQGNPLPPLKISVEFLKNN